MNQEASTLEDMRADHQQWDYVLSDLAKLRESIRQYGDALDAHAETIERHQQGLREHDRAMADFAREGGGQIQEVMRQVHREHANRHNSQRAAHERIKECHHTAMVHLETLRAASEAAM